MNRNLKNQRNQRSLQKSNLNRQTPKTSCHYCQSQTTKRNFQKIHFQMHWPGAQSQTAAPGRHIQEATYELPFLRLYLHVVLKIKTAKVRFFARPRQPRNIHTYIHTYIHRTAHVLCLVFKSKTRGSKNESHDSGVHKGNYTMNNHEPKPTVRMADKGKIKVMITSTLVLICLKGANAAFS